MKPSKLSDLYVAMNDVGLVEFGGVGGRVQEQSMATGYLEAWHHTLGWEEATGWPGERERECELLIHWNCRSLTVAHQPLPCC